MAQAWMAVESDEWISESIGGRDVLGRNSFTEEKEGWFWLEKVWTSGMEGDGDIEGLKDKEGIWRGGEEGECSTPLGESFGHSSRG